MQAVGITEPALINATSCGAVIPIVLATIMTQAILAMWRQIGISACGLKVVLSGTPLR